MLITFELKLSTETLAVLDRAVMAMEQLKRATTHPDEVLKPNAMVEPNVTTPNVAPSHASISTNNKTGGAMSDRSGHQTATRAKNPNFAHKLGRGGWITPERKKLCAELFKGGLPSTKIGPHLDALPGPPVPGAKRLSAYIAGTLCLKRADYPLPPDASPPADEASLTMGPLATPAHPAPPMKLVPAIARSGRPRGDMPPRRGGRAQIIEWAQQEGWETEPFSLIKINTRCYDLGLPRWVEIDGRGNAVAAAV